ncbi:MAG TPA: SPOR domain-containing protein [Myxococcota bacterium]|nr:SPOR domain-containing protein [Myxococcota bacterium]
MTERDADSPKKSARRRSSPARWLYGGLLVAIGACIGIVIGSVSETPRMLLERMRGPVETVDLEAPQAPPAAPQAAPPLEAFGELQGGAAKPAPAPAPKREVAAVTPPAPKPAPAAAPAVSSPPPAPPASPAPTPAPAKSPDQIVRELEKKTSPPADARHPVIQVLSLAERKQADALVAKLKTQGFDPYVTAMPDKSGRYRVRVRPNGGQDPAELEQRLKALGLKTWATAE